MRVVKTRLTNSALPSGVRVRADHRVLGLADSLVLRRRCCSAAVDVLAVVHRGQAPGTAASAPTARRRPRTCWRTACRRRPAAARHVQDAAHRRLRVAGHVGVPVLAGDALRLLVGVDDEDLGVARGVPGAAGWTCSSPKRRPSLLLLDVMSWSRKKMTGARSARRGPPRRPPSSGPARSTPWTSAPMCGVSFSIRIDA